MGIPAACVCGFRLDAREALAGKTIKCPKCREPIEIPGEASGEPVRRKVPRGSGGRDLRMEAHYRAIAIWYRLSGLFCVGLAALLFFLTLASDGARIPTLRFALPLLILLGVGGLSFVIGFFLAKYSNYARLIAALLTLLAMLGQIVQIAKRTAGVIAPGLTVILCAAYLWAFLCPRGAALCTEDYAQRIADTPHLKPATFASPFFWGVLLVVAAGLLLALGAIIAFSR